MEPKTSRALQMLAGTGLILSGFIPIGQIETPWPPYTIQAWAWMEPFIWSFFVMGGILIAGALLENVRPAVSASAVLLGAISIILFFGTLVAGRKALYDMWFPGQLGPADMLEFHFWLLAIHFSAMLALLFGGMAEVGRRWRMDHSASQSS
jgi:hypothetical protein